MRSFFLAAWVAAVGWEPLVSRQGTTGATWMMRAASAQALMLAQALLGVAIFLFPMLWFSRKVASALGFELPDEIVAVFCSSKKTLASGMPMAKLLFGGNVAMGVLILPINEMQLFVCAVLARRYAARVSNQVA